MKHSFLILATLVLGSGLAYAQDYQDDIYYNPKKKTAKTVAPQTGTDLSVGAGNMAGQLYDGSGPVTADGYYYNPNLGENATLTDQDLDAYNRYGGYYETAIDTIGSGVGNSEDFVYTQQIQKYYNPTIVTDNSAVLASIIDNCYGNVNVVYTGGYPVFNSWTYTYSPWYTYNPWAWGFGWYSPGWSIAWTPAWGWGWGPSWGWYHPWWGPGWGWGWNYPGWGWGDGWAWHHPGYHPGGGDYHRHGGAGRPGNGRYNLGLGRDYRAQSGRGRVSGGRVSGGRYGNTSTGRFTGGRGTTIRNSGIHANTGRPAMSTTGHGDVPTSAVTPSGNHRGSSTISNSRPVTGSVRNQSIGSISHDNTSAVTQHGTTATPSRNTTTVPSRGTVTVPSRNTSGSTYRSSGNYNSTSRGNYNTGSRSGNSYRSSGNYNSGSRGSSYNSGSRGGYSSGSRGGYSGGSRGGGGGGSHRGGGGRR